MSRDVSTNRYKKAYENRGFKSLNFLDTSDLSVSFFKPESGKLYKILIILHEVKTKNNPYTEKGGLDYVLDIVIHRNIGVNKSEVVCPKNYGKPCPICEEYDNLKAANKEDDAKIIKPTRRAVYNIIDLKDPKEEIKLFNVSQFLFEEEIVTTAMGYNDEGAVLPFASTKGGNLIQFRAVDSKTKEWIEFKGFKFEERPEKYTPEYVEKLIDKTISPDELIKVYSYDELYSILHAIPMEDSAEVSKENSGESEREKRRRERQEKTQDTKEEKTENKCPAGLRFGEDLDSDPACDNKENGKCPVYAECEKEFERTHG